MIQKVQALAPAFWPTFVKLFTPKLVSVMREGYTARNFKADVIAGLTVAIVALPLSMAIAIASGVGPERGLFTSIVGGFLVSLLGGSRFQIGGPAGAFIVLVAATVSLHGVDGLVLATLMSGAMLMAMGYLQLGSYIKYIPYPVTVGFTAGIATIIFASQMKELLGLHLAGKEPGPLVEKLVALGDALPTVNPMAVAVAVATIALISILKKKKPTWPGALVAVVAGSVAAWALGLPVETIGSRFGGIPHMLPLPHIPSISLAKMAAVFPDAVAFTLLGGIESLLSAVVADSMSGRRHRSNCELVAQGVANIACSFCGGMPVTGTIARTATNVRSGAHGPVSGMLHAVFLLAFMLLAAPLASYIPLATLAGVLAVVAWNMAEKQAFASLLKASRGDWVVLMATFMLTIYKDLTAGIVVGFSLGMLVFFHRMTQSVAVQSGVPQVDDETDDAHKRKAYHEEEQQDDVIVYRISGAFFFGTAATVGAALDDLASHPKVYVIDFSEVPLLDSTAAATIEGFVEKARKGGSRVFLTGTSPSTRQALEAHHLNKSVVKFPATLAAGIKEARTATQAWRADR